MWDPPENIVSTTHQGFNKFCTKLSSTDTGTRLLYLPRPDPEECRCDIHSLSKKKPRYKQLADKKGQFHDEPIRISRETTNFQLSMSYNTRDTDEKAKSVYKTDYKERGPSIVQYRPLMAAVDSAVMPLMSADSRDAYRDPIGLFRYSVKTKSSRIQCAKRNDLLKKICSFWDKSFANYSEYMDTISKMGLNNMKNQQQYWRLSSLSGKLDDCFLSKRRLNIQ